MNDDIRITRSTPGETPDAESLQPDDVLVAAIAQLPDAHPSHDLWPAVRARIERVGTSSPRRRTITMTMPELAMAASFLVAVTAGAAWFASSGRSAATPSPEEAPVRAQVESLEPTDVQRANFADAQFDAAIADLERILRDERATLDPRTVIVIERNLRAIDGAIGEARAALDKDPANPYLNSHLADARRRKLELLRRATFLTTTGGD